MGRIGKMIAALAVAAGTGLPAWAQPLKYGGKELDREAGLDLYDSKARFYDPMLARTTTQDPLAERYYSISPYAWCANNPVRYTDENGDSVAVLHQRGFIGHLALLIQDHKGKWAYFSMNGTDVYTSSSSHGKSGV